MFDRSVLRSPTGEGARETASARHPRHLRLREPTRERLRAAHHQLQQRKAAPARERGRAERRARGQRSRGPRVERNTVRGQRSRVRPVRQGIDSLVVEKIGRFTQMFFKKHSAI